MLILQTLFSLSISLSLTVFRPFFRDHPGEPVPEENFWTLWCEGRLTEADTLTIQLGATPSGLTSAHLDHPLASCRPTNSVIIIDFILLRPLHIQESTVCSLIYSEIGDAIQLRNFKGINLVTRC